MDAAQNDEKLVIDIKATHGNHDALLALAEGLDSPAKFRPLAAS